MEEDSNTTTEATGRIMINVTTVASGKIETIRK